MYILHVLTYHLVSLLCLCHTLECFPFCCDLGWASGGRRLPPLRVIRGRLEGSDRCRVVVVAVIVLLLLHWLLRQEQTHWSTTEAVVRVDPCIGRSERQLMRPECGILEWDRKSEIAVHLPHRRWKATDVRIGRRIRGATESSRRVADRWRRSQRVDCRAWEWPFLRFGRVRSDAVGCRDQRVGWNNIF